jgi:hypothetical protein
MMWRQKETCFFQVHVNILFSKVEYGPGYQKILSEFKRI